MPTLHLISTTLNHELYQQLITILSDDDVLLFTNQGVYNLYSQQDLLKKYRCYALMSDLQAYGLLTLVEQTSCKMIDYPEFVQLGILYERSISWH